MTGALNIPCDTVIRGVDRRRHDTIKQTDFSRQNSRSYSLNDSVLHCDESLSSSQTTFVNPPLSSIDDAESHAESLVEEEVKPLKISRQEINERFRKAEAEFERQLSHLLELERSPKKWSGTGKAYDVDYEDVEPVAIRKELRKSEELGEGAFAMVRRTTCHSIPLARKSLHALSKQRLKDIKKEIKIGVSLAGHEHLVKLIGTYTTEEHSGATTYHILTFPVADCDMDKFLRNCVAARDGNFLVNNPNIYEMLVAASAVDIPGHDAFEAGMFAAFRNFLKRTMGCMADAVAWMHSTKVHIAHLDLKPHNMLLRNGRLYLTDFGLSKHRALEDNTFTEHRAGLSRGYAAPEVEDGMEYRPFRADIYSLGCIYLNLINVMHGSTLIEECYEVLTSPPYCREEEIQHHINRLTRQKVFEADEEGKYSDSKPPHKLLELIKEMLSNKEANRPKISEVNDGLRSMGGKQSAYHGQCCARVEDIPPELDEWSLVPTEDGNEILSGMELRIDRYQSNRPWDVSSFRTTAPRPIAPGEISHGFGLGNAREVTARNQLKPVFPGFNLIEANKIREALKPQEKHEAYATVSSQEPVDKVVTASLVPVSAMRGNGAAERKKLSTIEKRLRFAETKEEARGNGLTTKEGVSSTMLFRVVKGKTM